MSISNALSPLLVLMGSVRQFYLRLMNETQELYKKGQANECITTKLLDRQEELGVTDLDIAYICGQTFEGG